jgi:fumarate reductase flavoprotein subunit
MAAKGSAETFDVIVLGGGLAGYCAAVEAADHGARVVLLEREARNGGATVLSGGSFAFAGTDLQAQLGHQDCAQTLFDDLRRVGGYKNDEALVRTYAARQLDAYRWLGQLGVTFERLFIASGQSVPRAHSRNAREVLDMVVAAAAQRGVETRMSWRARRLIRRGHGAPVTGVEVDSDTGRAHIHARRGVVIATGGFSRNERLLELFAPSQARAQRMGGAGNQGDGLLMAWQLGAGLRDMGYIKGTFGTHPSAGCEDHFILFPIYAGAIAVNRRGRRFTDESRSYKLIGDACLDQPDQLAFQIFDDAIFRASKPGIPAMDFDADREAGRILRAATLRELAALIDIDADELQATVDAYNNAIAASHADAFGRASLCNGFGALASIARPPFYAYASTSVVLATYCGLAVDTQMRVLDVFDDVIEGLYAAGGVIGGFHGIAYMTGSANGKATIFGRIAGGEAATRNFA